MGVGAGLSMYVVVVQKFTFAISSPDEFLFIRIADSDRYACTTVTTFRLPVCFAQLVLSQRPGLNSTKSESILIGTRQRLRTLPPIASNIIG